MHPYVQLANIVLPTFGIMALLGIATGCIVIFIRCKLNNLEALDPMLTGCIALVGVVIGAKLLKPLIYLPGIIINWNDYVDMPIGMFFTTLFSETVFFGGLLGGFAAAFCFCKHFHIPFLMTADIISPAIPAGHAIGRIGCLLGGCCYGVQTSITHPLSIVYPERADQLAAITAPSGVPLLAVPIIESVGNLLIAAFVMIFGRKLRHAGQNLALYGLLYGVMRFVLEFYRGDSIRGVYYGISTSQIISIVVVVFSASFLLVQHFRNIVGKRIDHAV